MYISILNDMLTLLIMSDESGYYLARLGHATHQTILMLNIFPEKKNAQRLLCFALRR